MQINKPIHQWQLSFEGEWPTSVAFLGSSRRIAAANRAGQIFVWDLPESAPPPEKLGDEMVAPDFAPARRLDGHTNGVSRLAATADGGTLISASLDHSLRLWNVNAAASGNDQVVLNLKARERQARGKSKAEADQILGAPGSPVETVAASAVLSGHRDWIESLAISRDDRRFISGDERSNVIVWELSSSDSGEQASPDRVPAAKEISRFAGHAWNGIAAVALSPDGQTALVSEYRYKRDDFDIPAAALKLWNVADGSQQLDLLKLHLPKLDEKAHSYGSAQVWRKFIAHGLIAADFSPDGSLVAVGQGGETDTGQVHILDAKSGKFLRSISGHRYGVCDLKFSTDGKYLLSSGRDTSVRICQAADGKEVAVLGKSRGGQFKDWLNSIAISPDQTAVAAADIAGMVHIWQLQS